MKIFIGSILVIIITSIITWFLLSIIFKPVGKIVQKHSSSFKDRWEEEDIDEQI